MSEPEPADQRGSLYAVATKQERRSLVTITLSLVFAVVMVFLAADTIGSVLFGVSAVFFAWAVQRSVRDLVRRRREGEH